MPITKILETFAYHTYSYQVNLDVYLVLSTVYFCLSRFLPISHKPIAIFVCRYFCLSDQNSDSLCVPYHLGDTTFAYHYMRLSLKLQRFLPIRQKPIR